MEQSATGDGSHGGIRSHTGICERAVVWDVDDDSARYVERSVRAARDFEPIPDAKFVRVLGLDSCHVGITPHKDRAVGEPEGLEPEVLRSRRGGRHRAVQTDPPDKVVTCRLGRRQGGDGYRGAFANEYFRSGFRGNRLFVPRGYPCVDI